jgi:hypothetical protein
MGKEVKINDVVYVEKDEQKAECLDDMEYKIVRTYSAGVFAGYIASQSEDGKKITIKKARRLWKWSGAASLSQLAMEGVRDPDGCKFPCEVDSLEITEAIEILDCTHRAQKSISEVPIWSA